MKPVVEQYLEHLEQMVGVRGEYHLATEADELPAIWDIVYRDTPEEGDLTAFTFGLSSVEHTDWRLGRPELVISVHSSSLNWGLALGFLVKRFRGKCPFSYGNVVRFGGPVCDESGMSAFLIFIPTILEKDQAQVNLHDRTINIVQAYPIYEEEIRLIEQAGAQRFFMQEGVDFYDVRRKNTGTTGV
jgi:hypothetical protein